MTSRAALRLGLAAFCAVGPWNAPDGRVRAPAGKTDRPRMVVRPTEDFEVTGTGEHASWRAAAWALLGRRQADGHPYTAQVKMLYSPTGLYFLIEGTDRTLTASLNEDFMQFDKFGDLQFADR